jgi:Flp pilus assembly protein TadG
MRQLRESAFLRISRGARAKQRGVYALAFAVLMIPLIGVVGCAVDYARIVQYKSDLQNAVDEAAIAGAAALTNTDSATAGVAATVATNYFNRAILPASMSVSAPNVVTNTTSTAKLPNGNGAFTVQVSASATVSNTLFALFVPSVNVSATGTAAEPLVTADLSLGHVNNQACDSNTLSIYLVPKNTAGTAYDYSTTALNALPQSSFVTVGPTATSSLPAIGANQPLGIRLQNETGGGTCNYGANQYGAQPQSYNLFYSSLLGNGMSPSEINNTVTYTAVTTTNTSNNKITQVSVTQPSNPASTPATSTTTHTGNSLSLSTYTPGLNCTLSSSSTNNSIKTSTYTCITTYKQEFATTPTPASALPNCSLYMQTGVSQTYVNNLSGTSSAPTASSNHCFTPTQAGAPYAAPTCSQLSALANGGNAPAAVFWWNDGGGTTDDLDYNDAYFAATCTVSGGTGSGNTEVVLIQ